MNVASNHPDCADLEAFSLGTLDDTVLPGVEAHIADCLACQERAAAAADDTLVELLRRVKARSASRSDTVAPVSANVPTPAPVSVNTETIGLAPTALDRSETLDGLLPELAQHVRYRMLRLIGAGGMGSVYEAEHRVMQRAVALKVINRAYTASPAAVERFRREVRAAARLSHPNIVTTYDAEDAGNTLFLVMEYVEGVSLARLVKERGPLPIAEACAYIREAALGLQHAHERGMVHRDIKPDNLIRCTNGTVKVLDFGLASLTAEHGSGLTEANAVMGTPDYMAPEQAEDARSADIRADVYSLGCTLTFLLTGQPPYAAATPLLKILAHRQQPVPSLRRARPEVPAELAAVVARMLAKKPAARFQTPAEIAAALAPFVTTTTPTPPKKPRRKLLVALAALLLAGVALAGGAVYHIQTDKGDLVITTDSDDVEVVIKQGGKVVRIIDTKTDKQITLALRSGSYELELKGAPEGLKLDIDKATLTRGEKVLAKIEREPKKVVAEPKNEPKDPGPEIKKDLSKWTIAELPEKPGLIRTFPARAVGVTGLLSPDGRLFALPEDDNPTDIRFTRIYETATGRFVRDVSVPNEFPSGYTFFPDSKRLLLCSTALGKKRWTFRIFDIETGEDRRLTHIEPLEKWPTFRLSADGKRLLVYLIAEDHKPTEIMVLDLETGRVQHREDYPRDIGNGLLSAHLLDNGKWLLWITSKRESPTGPWRTSKFHLVDLENKSALKDIDVDAFVTDPFLTADAGQVGGLCHRKRLEGGAEVSVQTWDLATGKLEAGKGVRIPYNNGAMLRAQGRRVITVDLEFRIRAFDLPSGKQVFSGDPDSKMNTIWDVSADGRVLAVPTPQGCRLYRLPDVTIAKDKP